MSEVVGEAVVRLRTDESGVNSDALGKKAGAGYSRGFSSTLKGLGAAIGGVLAAKAVLGFAGSAIAEARESQKVTATTNQIIKATGSAAHVTSGQVGALATSISQAAGVDDELVQSGANLILTFKNVRNEAGRNNDVFNRATKAAVDLSAAGFGSVQSASVMLGKALNDPLKGISALGRAGVTFSEAQKTQIKQMVQQGDLLGAQKVILKEVNGQVGGVAAATATAGEKATVAWGNVKEAVGTLLLPVLDAAANMFTNTIAPAIQSFVGYVGTLGPTFSRVGDSLSGAFAGVGDFLAPVVAQISAFATGPGLAALQEFGVQAVAVFQGQVAPAIQSFLPVLQQAAATFTTVVLPAVTAFATYVISSLVPVFLQVEQIIVGNVIPAVLQIATFIYGSLYPAIVAIVIAVAQNLKPVFDQLVATFQGSVLPTVQRLIIMFQTQLLPVLQPLIMNVVQVIGVFARFASVILGAVLPVVIRIAGFLLSNLVPAIFAVIIILIRIIAVAVSFVAAMVRTAAAVASFGTSLVRLVSGGLAQVVSAVAALPGKIIALGGKMLSAGKSIMEQFLSGLKNAGGFASGIADAVWGAVRGVVNSAIDRLNGLLDFSIHVGPKTFHVSAPNIGHLQAGTTGIQDGGVFRVGEVGVETVYLPENTRVRTAAQTRQDDAAASEAAPAGPIDLSPETLNALAALIARMILEGSRMVSQQSIDSALVGLAVG